MLGNCEILLTFAWVVFFNDNFPWPMIRSDPNVLEGIPGFDSFDENSFNVMDGNKHHYNDSDCILFTNAL